MLATCFIDPLMVLTRKLQLGPSGPNWESERSEHAHVSAPKCSWGVWGGGYSEPSFPLAGLLWGQAI